MTPERLSQASALEERHRNLVHELRAWNEMSSPPVQLVSIPPDRSTPIPTPLWLTFKAGVVAHLQAQIKANREAFEAL